MIILFILGVGNILIGWLDSIYDPDMYTYFWIISGHFQITWFVLAKIYLKMSEQPEK